MNTTGRIFRVTTFGESHGAAVGGVIDGMPAGIEIDLDIANKISDKKKLPRAELHGCESCPLASTCSKVVSEREDKMI